MTLQIGGFHQQLSGFYDGQLRRRNDACRQRRRTTLTIRVRHSETSSAIHAPNKKTPPADVPAAQVRRGLLSCSHLRFALKNCRTGPGRKRARSSVPS
jgi:hypothetical protein